MSNRQPFVKSYWVEKLNSSNVISSFSAEAEFDFIGWLKFNVLTSLMHSPISISEATNPTSKSHVSFSSDWTSDDVWNSCIPNN